MREIQRRKRLNLKELVLRNIYDNLKSYIIVICIFIIGIIAGVIFINNIEQEQETEIKEYINNFISQIKQNYQIDKGELLKSSLLDNVFLIVSMWFIGSTVIGIPIVFGIVIFRGFCLGYTVSSIIRSFRSAKRSNLFIWFNFFTKPNIYTGNYLYDSKLYEVI